LPSMNPEDLAALRRAVQSLEHPGLAVNLSCILAGRASMYCTTTS
jgi:hypothetical protein